MIFLIIFSIGNGIAIQLTERIQDADKIDGSISKFYQFEREPAEDFLHHRTYGKDSMPLPAILAGIPVTMGVASISFLAHTAVHIHSCNNEQKETRLLREFGILDCIKCSHRTLSDEWGSHQKQNGQTLECHNCNHQVKIEKKHLNSKKMQKLTSIFGSKIQQSYSSVISTKNTVEARKIKNRAGR